MANLPDLCAALWCAVSCCGVLCSGVLREYYFSLGDEGAMEERQRQLQRLSQLLAGLGVDIAAEVAERGGIEAVAAADAVADADGEQVRPRGGGRAGIGGEVLLQGGVALSACGGGVIIIILRNIDCSTVVVRSCRLPFSQARLAGVPTAPYKISAGRAG